MTNHCSSEKEEHMYQGVVIVKRAIMYMIVK